MEAKGHALSSQLAKFLAASYRVHGLTTQELKVDPGLSIIQEIVSSWRQITMTLHPEFVREMTGTSEKIFSSLQIKTELVGPVRKKCHDTQLSVFNRLQTVLVGKQQ